MKDQVFIDTSFALMKKENIKTFAGFDNHFSQMCFKQI